MLLLGPSAISLSSYFFTSESAINLSLMEPIQDQVDQLGAIENKWWSNSFPQHSDYRSLPETSKWVCRLERVSADGAMSLKVSTAGQIHFFPTFYTSIFMLLDLQQLSSLAEAIKLPPSSPEISRHMKNVNFLNQLRLQILTGARVPEELEDSPFLKRWIIRLIHRIPNSKTLREREPEKEAEIYSKFKIGCSWKKGISLCATRNFD